MIAIVDIRFYARKTEEIGKAMVTLGLHREGGILENAGGCLRKLADHLEVRAAVEGPEGKATRDGKPTGDEVLRAAYAVVNVAKLYKNFHNLPDMVWLRAALREREGR